MGSEMKPGRELDALVAEKVMGLVVDLDNSKYFDGTQVATRKEDFGAIGEAVQTISGVYHPRLSWPLPHYSTDIAAAWEVVERLSAENWIFDLLEGAHEGASPWRAHFMREGERSNGYGDSAPHAICLAALKAVGVKID